MTTDSIQKPFTHCDAQQLAMAQGQCTVRNACQLMTRALMLPHIPLMFSVLALLLYGDTIVVVVVVVVRCMPSSPVAKLRRELLVLDQDGWFHDVAEVYLLPGVQMLMCL